jgi:hypothetical protein
MEDRRMFRQKERFLERTFPCGYKILPLTILSGILLLPPTAGSQQSDLLMATRVAMLTVQRQAMMFEDKKDKTMGVSIPYFQNDFPLAYTHNTKRTWVRYIDNPSREKMPHEKVASAIGLGDELIIMDYSHDTAYVHKDALHEKMFFHVKICVKKQNGETYEQEHGQPCVEFLKAKVQDVLSMYPSNWTVDEEKLVIREYEKRIKGFLEEYDSFPTATISP